MTQMSRFELNREIARESQRPKGQGDGWTLDQHLTEHARLPTAVNISSRIDLLMVSHSTPGRVKFWIALGLLIVASSIAWFLGWVPKFSFTSVSHYAVGLSILALFVATLYASAAHTRMGINKNGLIARPWPYVPGIGVAVPLKSVRRFKVNRVEKHKKYELLVITKEGKELRIVPHIVRKRDAYLLAMLLIDRVKKLRAG